VILSFFLAWLSDGLAPSPSQSTNPMFSMDAARHGLKTSLPWCGAIFAAVYAALYTRFSSQWTYVAGLYNQIKATEAQTAVSTHKDAADGVLASWKAGFIEDADDLHLALKPMFAALIKAWSQDEKVQGEFATHSPGGQERLEALLSDVDRVLQERARDYERKALTSEQGHPLVPPSDA
jgi:hypothetical protein